MDSSCGGVPSQVTARKVGAQGRETVLSGRAYDRRVPLTPQPMRALRAALAAVTLSLLSAFPRPLAAQLDLTVDHKGIAIGDVPRVTGLRINYRDRHLERVDGVNATIW